MLASSVIASKSRLLSSGIRGCRGPPKDGGGSFVPASLAARRLWPWLAIAAAAGAQGAVSSVQ